MVQILLRLAKRKYFDEELTRRVSQKKKIANEVSPAVTTSHGIYPNPAPFAFSTCEARPNIPSSFSLLKQKRSCAEWNRSQSVSIKENIAQDFVDTQLY